MILEIRIRQSHTTIVTQCHEDTGETFVLCDNFTRSLSSKKKHTRWKWNEQWWHRQCLWFKCRHHISLFRDPSNDVTRELTRGINHLNSCRCAKETHEYSFNRLASFGWGKVSKVKSKNRKMILVFETMSLVGIAKNPFVLDKFPEKIKFEQHESHMLWNVFL